MELNVLTMKHAGSFLRLAWRRLLKGRKPRAQPSSPPAAQERPIDVQELIRSLPLEGHLAKAEAYFSSLTDLSWHLAKPFGSAEQAPALLIHLGAVLQALRLGPGMRVLDFGAGTGWTSHALSQMGAEVIVLDVSESALRIAQTLYESQPPFGEVPAPSFLKFDGRKIDLPDGSVDRILCFDAFHHAPNPEEVLREFARVLADGGVAAFSEPGPGHSRTPQSQSEMRDFGVIENDVHIEQIWEDAKRAGFGALQMAAFHVPARHLSLDGYNDLLRGGPEFLYWAEATRSFLHDVRTFYLVKGQAIRLDSRRSEGVSGRLETKQTRIASPAGAPITLEFTVINDGAAEWLPSGARPGGVALGLHLRSLDSGARIQDWKWADLVTPKRRVQPGEELGVRVQAPPLAAGEWVIEADLVADRVAWLSQLGMERVEIAVSVR